MATAQLLKITHAVSDTVKLVLDGARRVTFPHWFLREHLCDQTEEKQKQIYDLCRTTLARQRVCSLGTPIPVPHRFLIICTGNLWRQDLRRWFSSPDPSTNHIILCGAQHKGTAKWFFRSSLLEEWKSTGSLLWIHGKRTSSNPSPFHSLIRLVSIAGSGKSVLWCAVPHVSLIIIS